ncbi:MAG: hypothetical protein ACRC5G_02665 [Cetobacterium sp.]
MSGNIISNNLIKVTTSLTPNGENLASCILDENLETGYLSNGKYSSGEYADIVLKISSHKVIEKVEFYTENINNTGLIQSFEILYKNNVSTTEWVKIVEATPSNSTIGWREVSFEPVYANEICVRIKQSNGRFVAMKEIRLYNNMKLEIDLATLIDDTDGKLSITKDIDYSLIKEIDNEFLIYKELKKITEIIKVLHLSKEDVVAGKDLKVLKSNSTTVHFSKTLNIVETKRINHLNVEVESNKNTLILSNLDCQMLLLEDNDDVSFDKIINLKAGINTVYLQKGSLALIGDYEADVFLKIYGASKAEIFKMGSTKVEEFLNSKTSNKNVYVEGKNFISILQKEWIKNNFTQHTFVDSVKALDTIYDYVYNSVDINLKFEKSDIKRILVAGKLEEEMAQKNSIVGSYSVLGGQPELILQPGVHKLANKHLFKLLGREMVTDSFPAELKELLCIAFSKMLELKYIKSFEYTGDVKFDNFIKVMLYSNSDRFLTRVFREYQDYSFEQNEKPLDRLVTLSSQLLLRNVGKLMVQSGYEISDEILENTQKYPDLFLDLNTITTDNYKEFFREERRLFNENYLNKMGSGII